MKNKENRTLSVGEKKDHDVLRTTNVLQSNKEGEKAPNGVISQEEVKILGMMIVQDVAFVKL